jgi:hypothetical protein
VPIRGSNSRIKIRETKMLKLCAEMTPSYGFLIRLVSKKMVAESSFLINF